MSNFTAPLQYRYLDNGLAEIIQPVRFYLSDDKTGLYIELPVGALTNFATVPKALRCIFPVDHEDYKMAAAFHDWLTGEFNKSSSLPWVKIKGRNLYVPSWQESANWFREMMKVRQAQRRNKRVWWKKILGFFPDVITRNIFWIAINLYGLIK